MAYCRWSTPECDVYVYESTTGGWMTHVASRRTPGGEPIAGPSDGETFTDSTAEECAETLIRLRDEGYRVPQGVIDTLMAECPECFGTGEVAATSSNLSSPDGLRTCTECGGSGTR